MGTESLNGKTVVISGIFEKWLSEDYGHNNK